MDKLQWFKFTPSDWMMGKIQKCPADTRGMFMNLCCLYWNKECTLSFEDAEIEVDDHLNILVKKKIIQVEGENVRISFLDEQLEEILETSEKRREAANKRWKKKNAKGMQVHASALQSDADKSESRVDLDEEGDIEKEKKKKKETLLCSISDESELERNEKIAFSFWKLFKKHKKEVGIEKTKLLDKAKLSDWSRHVDLTFRIDGRTHKEFKEVYRFLNTNEWWKGKVQSTQKLRDQFEQLLERSRENSGSLEPTEDFAALLDYKNHKQ